MYHHGAGNSSGKFDDSSPDTPTTVEEVRPAEPRLARLPPPTEDEISAAPRVCDRPTLTMIVGPQAGSLADEMEESLLKRQYESSILDGLTGVANRRHLDDRLASELAYAKRHGQELCLLLIDVDHFKRINDLWGHPMGDHVLRRLGPIVKRALRLEDVFARYGGEEFAILSRGTDLAHGLLLAERIRFLVQSTNFDQDDHRIPITVSVGVACLADCGGEFTSDRLIASADVALYRAKAAGRNCCRALEGASA